MREQLHDDNFEDFLREKINEFDGEPNSQMWDRIEGVIPPAPKPLVFKYLTPVTAAASVVLTLSVMAAVYQYRSNRDLNQQLIEATDKIKTLENQTGNTETDENKDTDNTISLEEAETLTENQASDKAQKRLSNQSRTSDKTQNNNPTTKNQSNVNNNTSDDVKKDNLKPSNNINNKKPSVTDTDNSKNKNTTPDSDIKNQSPTPLQSNIDNKTSVANQASDEQSPTDFEEQEKDTEKIFDLKNPLASKDIAEVKQKYIFWGLDSAKVEVPKFRDHLVISAFIQPMHTRAILRATSGPGSGGGNQPFNQHKVKPISSWSTGFTLGYQANKNWSVHAGVAYQTSQFDMEFDTRIKYEKMADGQLSPNGLRIHRRPYLVVSPFGDMEIGLDLRRNPDVQIPDEVPMRVFSTGKHEITSVALPVYIQAQTAKGALKTGIKFGIAPQIVTNSTFKLQTVAAEIEGPLDVTFTNTESVLIYQPELHRQVVVDGLLGLVFAYQINPDAEFSLEPTFMANMGRKHDTQFGSTQLVSTGLQIGYKYHF